ncbi:MAG: glycosyltransferase family 39 protein [Phycisphaerales bacterium]|nr:glycosyltransferase family 39 protein [Phycisphaerales bacterium]
MKQDTGMAHGRWSSRILMAALLMSGALVFCTGITWGLPSRDVDSFLFGTEPVWTGEKIQRLAGERPIDPSRGADMDVNPVIARGESVVLNETDHQRAEIIRRYRLYTNHPDEMVTMMALSTMRPGQGDFDPRLYQYGGLWIYPVGLLLKVADILGAITLTGDIAYYLDRPEEFGRFYVVARLYVVAWALVGVWAVYLLVLRLSGGDRLTAAMATLCFMFMPVVVTVTHEAKPHLPGVVLTLLTTLAAIKYLDSGRRGWGLIASVSAGAAFGMVLNAWPALLILPTMVFLQKQTPRKHIEMTILTGAAALVTFFITNPYVLIHLIGNRPILHSNLANTRAMFTIGPFMKSLGNGFLLLAEGVSPVFFGACICGLTIFGVRTLIRGISSDRKRVADIPAGILLLVLLPACSNLIQFLLFAWNQNADYGRFALLAEVLLGIMAMVILGRVIRQTGPRAVAFSVMWATTAFWGYDYLQAYKNDSTGLTSRLAVAWNIRQFEDQAKTLGVFNDPAPYSLPPVNLFHWRLELLPKDSVTEADPVDLLAGITHNIEKYFASRADAYTAVGYFGPAGLRDMICWADQGMICLLRTKPQIAPTEEGFSDAP